MKYLTAVSLSALFLAGCGKKAEEPVRAQPEPQPPPLERLQTKVQELMTSGQTNAVIEVLSSALEDETYAAEKGRIFPYLMRTLLSMGRVDEARERYLSAIETDETAARSAFGMIGRYYTTQGNTNALTAWVEVLTKASLPGDVAEEAFKWHLYNKMKAGQLDDVLALVPDTLERFGPEGAIRAFHSVKSEVTRKDDFEGLERLLAEIEKIADGDKALLDFVAVSRVETCVQQQKWSEAEERFLAVQDSLDENGLRACLASVVGAADKAGKNDLADRVCQVVFAEHADKPKAVHDAARRWVQSVTPLDIAETCRRLKTVMEEYISPSETLALYRTQFYKIIENGTDEDRRAMLELGRELDGKLTNEGQRDAMKSLLFDGSFLVKDYATAVKILEEGLPDRDEAWHAMAINKLKAHEALDSGNIDEAVERFRKFMEHVASSWTEAERDPSTGLRHTREMALGFNAKRIGDILNDAGQTTEAQAAYAEARDYYMEANRKLKPTTKEHKVVQEMLAAMPVSDTEAAAADK